MQCLNVSVPKTADDKLNLGLEYITIFENRKAVKENISFPWDENTQGGTFILNYDATRVTYKVVFANENFTFLCGYASLIPIPLVKIFTRQRQVDPTVKFIIESALERYGVAKYVVWTEQSPEQCHANAAIRLGVAVPWAIIALAMLWNSYNWMIKIIENVLFLIGILISYKYTHR